MRVSALVRDISRVDVSTVCDAMAEQESDKVHLLPPHDTVRRRNTETPKHHEILSRGNTHFHLIQHVEEILDTVCRGYTMTEHVLSNGRALSPNDRVCRGNFVCDELL